MYIQWFWDFMTKQTDKSKLILTHTGTLTPGQRVEFLLESVLELVLDKSIDISDVEIRFIGIEYLNTQKNE